MNEIRERNDIVDVIKEYITLKRAGQVYKGNCPFHNEKTPSFVVNPKMQIFKCFGCGVGGNVINFVMKKDNLTYYEALRRLAKRVGMEPPRPKHASGDARRVEKKERLLKLNKEVADNYRAALHSKIGEEALAYINRRGISDRIRRRFKLGFAPDSWDTLTSRFRNNTQALEDLVELGLITPRKESEGYFDTFRNKIVFPIMDHMDEVIGFGFRRLSDSGEDQRPKYINSRNSMVYQKQYVIYGISQATDAIRQKDSALIVEGYFDLLALAEAGFENCVATCGTALTGSQIRLIKRFSRHITMVYDGDEAGVNAMLRGIERMLPQDVEIKIAPLPGEHDPDTFVREKGPDEFELLLSKAPSFSHFVIETLSRRYKIKSTSGKVEAVQALSPFVELIASEIVKDDFVKRTAEKLELDISIVKAEMARFKSTKKPDPTFKTASWDPQKRHEADLIFYMAYNDKATKTVAEHLLPHDFTVTEHRKIVQCLFDELEKGHEIKIANVIDVFTQENLQDYFEMIGRRVLSENSKVLSASRQWTNLIESENFDIDNTVREYIAPIKYRGLKLQCQEVKTKLNQALEKGDDEQASTLLLKRIELEQNLRKWYGSLNPCDEPVNEGGVVS